SPVTDIGMLTKGLGVLIVPHLDTDDGRKDQRMRELSSAWSNVSAVLVGDDVMPLVRLRGVA
ncbi:hypothetical protein KJ766_03710, partial [Patescibacteria group bacterium]|nr:hypothetical protein [Patescibacteria group bacterium]